MIPIAIALISVADTLAIALPESGAKITNIIARMDGIKEDIRERTKTDLYLNSNLCFPIQ